MFNKNIEAIVDALKNAASGREIYEALQHVPTENLIHMQSMIVNIINSREPYIQTCGRVSRIDK